MERLPSALGTGAGTSEPSSERKRGAAARRRTSLYDLLPDRPPHVLRHASVLSAIVDDGKLDEFQADLARE